MTPRVWELLMPCRLLWRLKLYEDLMMWSCLELGLLQRVGIGSVSKGDHSLVYEDLSEYACRYVPSESFPGMTILAIHKDEPPSMQWT